MSKSRFGLIMFCAYNLFPIASMVLKQNTYYRIFLTNGRVLNKVQIVRQDTTYIWIQLPNASIKKLKKASIRYIRRDYTRRNSNEYRNMKAYLGKNLLIVLYDGRIAKGFFKTYYPERGKFIINGRAISIPYAYIRKFYTISRKDGMPEHRRYKSVPRALSGLTENPAQKVPDLTNSKRILTSLIIGASVQTGFTPFYKYLFSNSNYARIFELSTPFPGIVAGVQIPVVGSDYWLLRGRFTINWQTGRVSIKTENPLFLRASPVTGGGYEAILSVRHTSKKPLKQLFHVRRPKWWLNISKKLFLFYEPGIIASGFQYNMNSSMGQSKLFADMVGPRLIGGIAVRFGSRKKPVFLRNYLGLGFLHGSITLDVNSTNVNAIISLWESSLEMHIMKHIRLMLFFEFSHKWFLKNYQVSFEDTSRGTLSSTETEHKVGGGIAYAF